MPGLRSRSGWDQKLPSAATMFALRSVMLPEPVEFFTCSTKAPFGSMRSRSSAPSKNQDLALFEV